MNMKDWIGNGKSVFVCNGASNHSDSERQCDDFYATDPKAIHKLCAVEKFTPMVWECACGTISVWNEFYLSGERGINAKQKSKLKQLKLNGLYRGKVA